jgi:hypothetical protein
MTTRACTPELRIQLLYPLQLCVSRGRLSCEREERFVLRLQGRVDACVVSDTKQKG